MSDIHASVWSADGATQLALLPDATKKTWQDPFNGAGSGSLTVPGDDPAAAALRDRNIVKFSYAGDYRYAFRIQQPKNVVVAGEGVAGQTLRVTGPGVMSMLDDAVLYPEYGLARSSLDQRAFTFASQQSDWYIASEWVAPASVVWKNDTTNRAGYPKDWPDKYASWIWDTDPTANSPAGHEVFFRSTFVVAADDTDVKIYATADNTYDLYLDGQLILTTGGGPGYYTWRRTSWYPTTLAAGTHLLAARGQNGWVNFLGGGTHAGFLCAVATVDDNGDPQSIIRHTGPNTWLCRPYDGTAPSWRAAQILHTFITEAQARGVTAATNLTVDFTRTLDTDGNAWTDSVDRTFTVGTKGLDLVEQLTELSIDIAVGPDLVVHAWTSRGTDKSTGTNPVLLRPARNLTGYGVDTDLKITTRLLVRTPTGWVEVAAANEATDGRIEDMLSLGQSGSDAQATRQANAAFDDIATPVTTFTATCLPVPGATPYVDFDNGDVVLAPDGAGGTVALRCVSISVSEDDNGAVTFVPELYPA